MNRKFAILITRNNFIKIIEDPNWQVYTEAFHGVEHVVSQEAMEDYPSPASVPVKHFYCVYRTCTQAIFMEETR